MAYGYRSAWSTTAFLVVVLSISHLTEAADSPLTLDQALHLAQQANAQLPVAQLNSQIAKESVEESESKRWVRISVSGTLPYSPSSLNFGPGATASEASVLLDSRQPLYAGGTLQGQLTADRQRLESARAGTRVSERDVDLSVRRLFSEVLFHQASIKIQQEGFSRLDESLRIIEARKASGQGIEADLLKARVRSDEQKVVIAEAQRNQEEALAELNVVLGKAPDQPLELVPLEEPATLPEIPPENPSALPDLAAAEADQAVAEAMISVVRGGFRPQLDLFANTGFIDPGIGVNQTTASSSRLRDDFGVVGGIDLSWKIWQSGAYQAQRRAAQLTFEKAKAQLVVEERQDRLHYVRAAADVRHWFEEFQLRQGEVPQARDAYLVDESLYRGGQGTAVNVLQSFNAWVNAEANREQALYQLRLAWAEVIRWSGAS